MAIYIDNQSFLFMGTGKPLFIEKDCQLLPRTATRYHLFPHGSPVLKVKKQ
jgi:hypothetical protein